MSWWAPQLNPSGLSQGDILAPILIGTSASPAKFLGLGPFVKSGKTAWGQIQAWKPDSSGLGVFVARGRLMHAIVVSHSCELDDKADTNRVLIAPIARLDVLPEQSKVKIIAQERRAFLPLQGIPVLGDYYADLRCMTYVDRANIASDARLASMTDDGVIRLQAQLVTFFARLDIPGTIEVLNEFLATRGGG